MDINQIVETIILTGILFCCYKLVVLSIKLTLIEQQEFWVKLEKDLLELEEKGVIIDKRLIELINKKIKKFIKWNL